MAEPAGTRRVRVFWLFGREVTWTPLTGIWMMAALAFIVGCRHSTKSGPASDGSANGNTSKLGKPGDRVSQERPRARLTVPVSSMNCRVVKSISLDLYSKLVLQWRQPAWATACLLYTSPSQR